MARLVALLAVATSAHAFAPRHTMSHRESAHPWAPTYTHYLDAHGAPYAAWTSKPGGPTSFHNNIGNVFPRACDAWGYTASQRLHDAEHGVQIWDVQARTHDHTGVDIFYPPGIGGNNNRNNPFHPQHADAVGNLRLDINDFYVLGDIATPGKPNSNRLLLKYSHLTNKNLREDGRAVEKDLASTAATTIVQVNYPFGTSSTRRRIDGADFATHFLLFAQALGYPCFFERWPTVAAAPGGWPVAMTQPAGGRVMCWKDYIYHMCRGAGICVHPNCITPLNFLAPNTDPHSAWLARRNDMVHHYGMRSINAADDNILGFVCRKHGCM